VTSTLDSGSSFPFRGLEEVDGPARLEWVRAGIVFALIGYALSFAFEFVGDPDPRAYWPEAATVVLISVALWLTYRGSIALAAALTILPVWLEVHLGFFLGGELAGTGSLTLPVLVAGVAILLGGRAATPFAVLTSLSAPGTIALGRVVRGVHPVFGIEEVKPGLILAAVLLAMAALLSFGLRYLGEALASARSNARRFSDLVAVNPDGIVALNPEGRIESMNPVAERLLGVSFQDARGFRLDEKVSEEGWSAVLDQALSGSGQDPLELEYAPSGPEGPRIRVEVVGRPLVHPDGPEGTMLLIRDLTKSREVEARATQVGRIVEEARNEIFVFDRDTLEILMANRGARENLGYARDEILGMPMVEIQPTLTPETVNRLAWSLFEGGEEVVGMNTIHHRKDGSVYPVEVRFQRGAMEDRPAILAFGTDTTEREMAEEEQRLLQAQLQHAQKMEAVGLLAGGVAHDFNNLLTVIGGCGEILLDIGDDEVRDLTHEILEAQERGAALTQQLLAFARREIVQVEDLSLSEVIQGSEVLIRRVMGERIQLELALAEGTTIRADRGQIEQVVLNLAANSRDAMEGGGTLTIRVETGGGGGGESEGDDFVALTVEDTGQGMDARTLERVFEPFFTTKPRGKGTGLGLSTVHGIVTQHGGRISVDSEPGKGTRIRLLWPPSQTDLDPGSPDRPEVERDLPAGTILVAEDEDGARTLILTILEREGYSVVAVEDGAEALGLLRDPGRSFDLLLTDIVMPGINGLELAEHVKEIRPKLPILFMSGFVDAHLQGPEGNPGALNLLPKPFRPPELRKRVREILSDWGGAQL